MARAPRRNPRAPSATGSAPSSGGPAPRSRGSNGQFARTSEVASAPSQPAMGSTLPPGFQLQGPSVAALPNSMPERPQVPAGSHVVAGGPENSRAFDAGGVEGEGANTPEAHAARANADEVLSDLFKKYESSGEAVGVGGNTSENGQPYGSFEPQQEAQRASETEQAPGVEAPVQTDGELLLEPVIYPGDEPAPQGAGVPSSGDPDSFQDPGPVPANAEDMARRALLRSGFLPSEVDAMSPDSLIARGMPRHEVLARDDDAHRRIRIGEPAGDPAPASSAAEPAPAGVPAEISIRETLEPLLEPVGEEGVAAVEKVISQRESKLLARIEALEGRDQARTETRVHELVASSRKGWVERFPQLQTGKVAGLVQRRMGLLVNDPAFNSPGMADQDKSDRIMLSACLSLGLQDTGKGRRQAAKQETRRRKQAGVQPVQQVQRDNREAPMSRDERQTGILTHLFSGKIDEARQFGYQTAR